jgi:hypothetical protein
VSPNDLLTVMRYYRSKRFKPWKLRFGNMLPHPAEFVRREVHGNFAPCRLGFHVSSDYEMFIRF